MITSRYKIEIVIIEDDVIHVKDENEEVIVIDDDEDLTSADEFIIGE